MTEPSIRERIALGIIGIFVDGGEVSISAVAAACGLSRQRIHDAGLRPLVIQFAVAQRELSHGGSQLASSRISALRAELALALQTSTPTASDQPSSKDNALVKRLRDRVVQLEDQVAQLQDEVVAERTAVALILRNLN